MADKSKPGLWANIHAKRKRGESPAKPGDEDYPDAKNWKKVTSISEKKAAPAWQTSEGKNPEGGLNEKGRASLKAQGHDIKRPQPEGGPRKDSFCARMKGMKAKLTSEETANDPDSRINKSLRKWKCGSANMEKNAMPSNSQIVLSAFGLRKSAQFSIQDLISKGKSFYNNADPRVQSAMMGSLLGGAAGGLGNMMLGSKRKSLLGRLGSGLLGGAVFGAGAGGLGQHLGLFDKSVPADRPKFSLQDYEKEYYSGQGRSPFTYGSSGVPADPTGKNPELIRYKQQPASRPSSGQDMYDRATDSILDDQSNA